METSQATTDGLAGALTYFDILEVEEGATGVQIRKAYLKKAAQCHPDRNPDDPSAKEAFQAVNEAYECLNDPTSKNEYEVKLRELRQLTARARRQPRGGHGVWGMGGLTASNGMRGEAETRWKNANAARRSSGRREETEETDEREEERNARYPSDTGDSDDGYDGEEELDEDLDLGTESYLYPRTGVGASDNDHSYRHQPRHDHSRSHNSRHSHQQPHSHPHPRAHSHFHHRNPPSRSNSRSRTQTAFTYFSFSPHHALFPEMDLLGHMLRSPRFTRAATSNAADTPTDKDGGRRNDGDQPSRSYSYAPPMPTPTPTPTPTPGFPSVESMFMEMKAGIGRHREEMERVFGSAGEGAGVGMGMGMGVPVGMPRGLQSLFMGMARMEREMEGLFGHTQGHFRPRRSAGLRAGPMAYAQPHSHSRSNHRSQARGLRPLTLPLAPLAPFAHLHMLHAQTCSPMTPHFPRPRPRPPPRPDLHPHSHSHLHPGQQSRHLQGPGPVPGPGPGPIPVPFPVSISGPGPRPRPRPVIVPPNLPIGRPVPISMAHPPRQRHPLPRHLQTVQVPMGPPYLMNTPLPRQHLHQHQSQQ